MADSILLLDHFPWYSTFNENIAIDISQIYQEAYSDIFDEKHINKLLFDMFEKISNKHRVDVVIIPLMAGAITAKAAQLYYKKAENAHVCFLPISRHPWVTFSMDDDTNFNAVMNEYMKSTKSYKEYLRTLFSKHQPKTILILDEGHDEGHIMNITRDFIISEYGNNFNFIFAALINETSGVNNMSPNSKIKASTLNYFSVESKSNTRNLTHLYYLLDNINNAKQNMFSETVAFWEKNNINQRNVYNIYSTPTWFSHEVGVLFEDELKMKNILTKIKSWGIKPLSLESRMWYFNNGGLHE